MFPLLVLALACAWLGQSDTVFTSQGLESHRHHFQVELNENPHQRFGDSKLRHSQYDHSPLSTRYYKHAFGTRVNSLLQSALSPEDLQRNSKWNRTDQIVEHYMIPMRDGVKLSTLVLFPPHMNRHLEQRGTMMSRSPYAPTSDQIADLFTMMNGFVAVVQDQRGTFLSEGEFTMWTHDAEDGEDTLNWILAQSWSNGKVFGSGISADGCSLASMFRLQPAPKLSGALYMWSSADGHETTYPGGSFRAGLISGWMTVQSVLTRGTSLTKTLPQLLNNWKLVPGGFWEPIQGPGKFHQVNWPTVHITGWFDIFQGLQIDMFNQFTVGASQHEHTLIVGALGHCLGGLPVKGDPVLDLIEARAVQMGFGYAAELFGGFDVRGSKFRDMLQRINVYVQGSHGTTVGRYWSSFPTWPKPEYRKLYLRPNQAMGFTPQYIRGNKEEYVEYQYNPAKPTATHGGNNFVIHLLGFGCGSMDQRHVENRTDVVAFDLTESLVDDLVLTGEVVAELYVSTDAKDTDFHVSLNDVHPQNEYSMQIRSGLQRLRLKDSTVMETVVTEIESNKVYKIKVKMWFTSYVIAKGHKLRIVINSSNTPYYATNPNTANEKDQYGFRQQQVANNRVYFSSKYPSHIVLPVVQLADLPKNYKI
ncbi:hypothetical protein BASA81_004900 [Batrachochytrium salamandrivorans]|nr:hypothetical protein BASA81_004900 [Batrachochytrium salamandrivorans]